MFSEKWKRRIFIFTIFGGIQFVVLTSIAMIVYSGEYIFFMYSFSEIGLTEVAGQPNIISFILWSITIFIFAISYPLFFLGIYDFFKENEKEKKQMILGIIISIVSAFGLVGVALTPGNIFPNEHMLFAFVFYLFALFSYAIFSNIILKNNNYPRKFRMISFILVICGLIYLIVFIIPPPYTTPIGAVKNAIFQKVVHYVWCICLVIQGNEGRKLSK